MTLIINKNEIITMTKSILNRISMASGRMRAMVGDESAIVRGVQRFS